MAVSIRGRVWASIDRKVEGAEYPATSLARRPRLRQHRKLRHHSARLQARLALPPFHAAHGRNQIGHRRPDQLPQRPGQPTRAILTERRADRTEVTSSINPASTTRPALRGPLMSHTLRRLLLAELVRNPKPPNLNQRLIPRWPDVQARHPAGAGDEMRVRGAHQSAGGGLVEMHTQDVACCVRVSKNIPPRLQPNPADPHRNLHKQIVDRKSTRLNSS